MIHYSKINVRTINNPRLVCPHYNNSLHYPFTPGKLDKPYTLNCGATNQLAPQFLHL